MFKSEPRTTLVAPSETTLSPDFVTWLKNNFSWLWATAQTNATLGDSYNYGDSGNTQIPGWALLGEYGNGGANSTGRTEYIWLPTEDGSAIPVGMYRSSKFYAIHTDHLGTPRLITDNANQPVWQWAYSAFGDNAPTGILKPTTAAASAYLSIPPTAGSGTTTATLLAVSAPTQVFNLRFPGQFNDSETGSFYNYYRTYQASQGRYTQPDPIGLDGGWSRFAYVNGHPLSMTDPKGLMGGGNGAAHRKPPPTVSGFGCMGLMCVSGGTHNDGPQFSTELTFGGGVEICDASPPPPDMCMKPNLGAQPPGIPLPKRFGGAFFGPSLKANGQFCLRIGPHVSFPLTPFLDLGGSRN